MHLWIVECTRRKGLPQLVGLVRVLVLQGKGVEVTLAADLELDGVGSGALLDPRGCNSVSQLIL